MRKASCVANGSHADPPNDMLFELSIDPLMDYLSRNWFIEGYDKYFAHLMVEIKCL